MSLLVDRQAAPEDTTSRRGRPAARTGSFRNRLFQSDAVHDPADALGQPDRADVEVVRGERLRLLDDAQPVGGGIELERFRRSFDLNLLPNRLCGVPWPRLGPHVRFVRETRQP